jgi:alkylation response protein AidB-like acyl-CoA dehydrogenase
MADMQFESATQLYPNLTDKQRHWVTVAESLRDVIGQNAARHDAEASFPHESFAAMREAGLLKLGVPEEYGGAGEATGNTHLTAYLVTEAIARACPTTAWDLIIHFHQCGNVARLGNEEQKARVLGDVAAGALMGSLGSEVNHQQATAGKNTVRTIVFNAEMMPAEGGFLANGTKHFCSNAPVADYLLYWSLAPGTHSIGEGISISVVAKGSSGLTFSEHGWDRMIGLRGSVSWSATLENVFIPWQNVLGEPGDYVQKDPFTLELSQAFHLLGCAQGAFDYIVDVLRQRPFLRNEEGLMVKVGEMASDLQAARASCLYAEALWSKKLYGPAAAASIKAHHTATDTAIAIATDGFSLVGTRALLNTAPLERIWRDARTASLHTRGSQLIKLAADASVDGGYRPKQKYGAVVENRKTWKDLVGLQKVG